VANKKVKVVISADDKFSKKLNKMGKEAQQFNKKLTKTGKTMTKFITLPILALGVASIKAASDFESSFTGVRKTVNATEKEFAQFSSQLRKMATQIPINVNELNGIAEAAGQLGIQNENLIGFTKVMANLGVTTNLSADEAATSLARFANITGLSQKKFENLGSAIVSLGNNFATTEKEIVEMGLRLAGAGTTIGLAETDILGLSTAMSSVGIRAEAGGSAFSKVMIEIAKAAANGEKGVAGFAEVAGVSAKEFIEQWRSDPANALQGFIKGLGEVSEEGGNMFLTLDSLELSGIRVIDVLGRMANNSEILADALQISETGFSENKALAEEAALRYKTFASQVKLLTGELRDLAIDIGQTLLPPIKSTMKSMKSLTKVAKSLSPASKAVAKTLLAIAAASGPVIFGIGKIRAAQLALAESTTATTVALKAQRLVLLSYVAVAAQAVTLIEKLTQSTEEANEEWKQFDNSMRGVSQAQRLWTVAVNTFIPSFIRQKEEVKSTTDGIVDMALSITETSIAIEQDMTPAVKESAAALEDFQLEAIAAVTGIGLSADLYDEITRRIMASNEDQIKSFDEARENLFSFAGVFAEMVDLVDLSYDKLITLLTDRLVAMREWSANMQIISSIVGEEMTKDLEDLGLAGAELVKELADNAEKLKEPGGFVELMEEGSELAGAGFVNRLVEKESEAEEAARVLAEKTAEAARNKLKFGMRRAGLEGGETLQTALRTILSSEFPGVASAATSLGKRVRDRVLAGLTGVTPAGPAAPGTNFPTGPEPPSAGVVKVGPSTPELGPALPLGPPQARGGLVAHGLFELGEKGRELVIPNNILSFFQKSGIPVAGANNGGSVTNNSPIQIINNFGPDSVRKDSDIESISNRVISKLGRQNEVSLAGLF